MRQDILDSLTPEAARWVDAQLVRFTQGNTHAQDSSFRDLVQMMLALGAQGEVILIGRGAGHILPRETTLSLRLIAPLADRVAYFGQWLRLPQQEAAEQVRQRDQRRNEYIERHFRQSPADVHLYDLVLNTGYIGEDLSVELIVQATRARLETLFSEPEESARLE
jgi:cytidylate kinase